MIKQNLRITLILLIINLLYACAQPVKEEPVVSESKPEPIVMPVVVEEPKQEAPLPVQQDVLILLSHSGSAYQQIADHLTRKLGEHSVQITLSGLPAQDKAVIKDIKSSSTAQIVAIGLKAVESVKDFKNKQIIYTQVIRHKNLITENVKGVSSLPSPEKLFKDWKQLSPRLSKVAIIAGKNLDLYLARAKKAAKAHKIELIIEEVSSDKGFIYNSKKLKSDVGGQWILPDNQVLSGKALKEVMAYASRRGRELVVFSPKLLPFGGFFYVNADLEAIADGILQRLSESAGSAVVSGDSVLPIMSHTMGINQNIARQFNLTIPLKYRKYINGK